MCHKATGWQRPLRCCPALRPMALFTPFSMLSVRSPVAVLWSVSHLSAAGAAARPSLGQPKRVTRRDVGSGEHIKAGGLQSFSEEQLLFEIFQRPPSALLLALMFFRWRQAFEMLDYRGKNVEENAVSPPGSFPHLLKGLILQVLLRQNCSQWGKDVFQDSSKVGSKHRVISSCLCCSGLVRQRPGKSAFSKVPA